MIKIAEQRNMNIPPIIATLPTQLSSLKKEERKKCRTQDQRKKSSFDITIPRFMEKKKEKKKAPNQTQFVKKVEGWGFFFFFSFLVGMLLL